MCKKPNIKYLNELDNTIYLKDKIQTKDILLNEILYCLNQIKNTKVEGHFFKNTYEICAGISKHLKLI